VEERGKEHDEDEIELGEAWGARAGVVREKAK
jgi:hypothetical protein